MIWEEHPEYQKQQAKWIGVLLVLLLGLHVGYCIDNQDWESLKQAFWFAGAIAISLAMLSAAGWLVMKILTSGQNEDSETK